MCRGNAYHSPGDRVNRRPAPIPMTERPMQPFETIYVDSMVVACNGGGGPLGHPRVYLNLAADGKIECPYCSRLFILRGRQGSEGHIAETPSARAPQDSHGGDHAPPAAPAKP